MMIMIGPALCRSLSQAQVIAGEPPPASRPTCWENTFINITIDHNHNNNQHQHAVKKIHSSKSIVITATVTNIIITIIKQASSTKVRMIIIIPISIITITIKIFFGSSSLSKLWLPGHCSQRHYTAILLEIIMFKTDGWIAWSWWQLCFARLTVSMFLFTWGNMEELLSFSCIFEMFEWVQNLIRAIGTMRKRDRCGITTIHNIIYSCGLSTLL